MTPVNRYLKIKRLPEPEVKRAPILVAVPETSTIICKLHDVFEVLDYSKACTIPARIGDKIIVQSNMIETVNVDGEEILFILENYVIACERKK